MDKSAFYECRNNHLNSRFLFINLDSLSQSQEITEPPENMCLLGTDAGVEGGVYHFHQILRDLKCWPYTALNSHYHHFQGDRWIFIKAQVLETLCHFEGTEHLARGVCVCA